MIENEITGQLESHIICLSIDQNLSVDAPSSDDTISMDTPYQSLHLDAVSSRKRSSYSIASLIGSKRDDITTRVGVTSRNHIDEVGHREMENKGQYTDMTFDAQGKSLNSLIQFVFVITFIYYGRLRKCSCIFQCF